MDKLATGCQSARVQRPHTGPARMVQSTERSRLSAADWEQAALELIEEQGVAAISVELLARRLGVTKGSFYWHFASRDALVEAALRRWEQFDTDTVVGQVDRIADPRERLVELFRRTSHEIRDHVIYSALMRAIDHPAVQPVMQRVSQRRVAYLAAAMRAAGLDRDEAAQRAQLAYAAYVGMLQLIMHRLLPRPAHEDFHAYVEHVIAALLPHPPVNTVQRPSSS